jgi:hypothetical protein
MVKAESYRSSSGGRYPEALCCFSTSRGNVAADVITQSIEAQEKVERPHDDDFTFNL